MSKAARTRERLQQVALHLFASRGYEQTTVADIAAAAGVTPMTFFRHFGDKEGVVLGDPYDPLIARLVAEHGRDGFARAWLTTRVGPWAADLLDQPQPGDLK